MDFELPVPQQIHSRFQVRARSIGMHRKVRFRGSVGEVLQKPLKRMVMV